MINELEQALALTRQMLSQGSHANEIRAILAQINPQLLSRLNNIPRKNIRDFILSASANITFSVPVLDVGAGYRSNQFEVASSTRNRNVKYMTFDHVLHPQAKSAQEWPNILADAMAIPIRTESVGTVICTEVLEHVPDPVQVLKEIARILHPGGLLILTLPGKDIPDHGKPPFQIDYRRFSVDEVRHLLVTNFKDFEISDRYFYTFQTNILALATRL